MPVLLSAPAAEELDNTVMSHSGELLLGHAPAVGDHGVALRSIDRSLPRQLMASEWMSQIKLGRHSATIYSVFTADGSVAVGRLSLRQKIGRKDRSRKIDHT